MVSFLEFKFEFWREKLQQKITREKKKELLVVFGFNFDGGDQSDEP
jgi:hypothetical protein